MKREYRIGVLFALLSATGLSFTGLFGKLGLTQFSLTALIFWRFLASFLITLVVFWAIGVLKDGLHFGSIRLHLLRAGFVLLTQYCFYYFIAKNTLLNAVVLLNTGPLFIPIIEWVFLRHHISKSTWIGVILSFLGVLCILQPDSGIFTLMSCIGLLSGISQGASQVIFGINSRKEKSDQTVLFLFFFIAIGSLFPYLFIPGPSWLSEPHETLWPILIVVALAGASLCNQLARAVAYHHSTPAGLSPFSYFSVLLAGLLDWGIYGNIPNFLSFIGAILVIGGGVLKICLRSTPTPL